MYSNYIYIYICIFMWGSMVIGYCTVCVCIFSLARPLLQPPPLLCWPLVLPPCPQLPCPR